MFIGMAVIIGLLASRTVAIPGASIACQPAELNLSKISAGGLEYYRVSLPNLIPTMNAGEPELPRQLVYLVIPRDQKAEGVNIVSAIPETLAGSYNVFPAQPPVVFGDPLPAFVSPDPEVYESSEPYKEVHNLR